MPRHLSIFGAPHEFKVGQRLLVRVPMLGLSEFTVSEVSQTSVLLRPGGEWGFVPPTWHPKHEIEVLEVLS